MDDGEELGMTIAAQVRPGERLLGIGIDTATVADSLQAAARFGDAYVRRVCSPAEAATLAHEGLARVTGLSRLWAAKEAVTKTLAPSSDDVWPWPAVEILPDGPGGAQTVRLHGHPARLAEQAGVRRLLVADVSDRNSASPSGRDTTVTMVALALGSCPTDDETSTPS